MKIWSHLTRLGQSEDSFLRYVFGVAVLLLQLVALKAEAHDNVALGGLCRRVVFTPLRSPWAHAGDQTLVRSVTNCSDVRHTLGCQVPKGHEAARKTVWEQSVKDQSMCLSWTDAFSHILEIILRELLALLLLCGVIYWPPECLHDSRWCHVSQDVSRQFVIILIWEIVSLNAEQHLKAMQTQPAVWPMESIMPCWFEHTCPCSKPLQKELIHTVLVK